MKLQGPEYEAEACSCKSQPKRRKKHVLGTSMKKMSEEQSTPSNSPCSAAPLKYAKKEACMQHKPAQDKQSTESSSATHDANDMLITSLHPSGQALLETKEKAKSNKCDEQKARTLEALFNEH